MGKPGRGDALSSVTEYIGGGGKRRELKHLSTSRNGKRSDFLSSGERKGISPNRLRAKPAGVAQSGSWDQSWASAVARKSYKDPG